MELPRSISFTIFTLKKQKCSEKRTRSSGASENDDWMEPEISNP
jgi:hypothetical protein